MPEEDDDEEYEVEEEAATVGLAEPEPLGGPFGSGAGHMSLSSRIVLCLTGSLGILLIS